MSDQKDNQYIGFACSSFHLICLNEFFRSRGILNYVVYCFEFSADSILLEQVRNTTDFLELRNVHFVKMPENRILQLFSLIFLLRSIFKFDKKNTVHFVIFDFRNTQLQFLRRLFLRSEFTLVDDGFSTVGSYNRYMKKGIFLPLQQYVGVKGFFIKSLYFGFSFNTLINKRIQVFSVYGPDLGLDKSSFNDLKYLQTRAVGVRVEMSTSIVFFLGGRLSEKGVITLDEEVETIRLISEFWARRGRKMIFVGKRVNEESLGRQKLSRLTEWGIRCVSFDVPFEIALLQGRERNIASIICSCGSTLNKTLPLIFSGVEAYFADISAVKRKSVMNGGSGVISGSDVLISKEEAKGMRY